MTLEHLKMALGSIRAARFRSFLTMFGIIIGVCAVVTIVSLGEGVKQQVAKQVDAVSDSLIIVRPGAASDTRSFNLDSLRTLAPNGSLSEKDWQDIQKVEGVASAVPIGVVSGIVSYDEANYSGGSIIATTSDFPRLLNQKVSFGEFFSPEDESSQVAVIGQDVAEKLFNENVPIGKSLTVRGKRYIVQGIFEQQKSGSFAAVNINTAVVIPHESAKTLGDAVQILQLYIEASTPESVASVSEKVSDTLTANHSGQKDFTILQKEEALEVTNEFFYQLTLFVAGVAFISFIVGGIGIMNIMFATVSERTKEIGIRKAVGATNSQILWQFVLEAIVLSVVGGIIGVLGALLANGVIRATTDLQPILTPEVVGLVGVCAVITGVASGLLPALAAARKDPITSLRSGL